MTNELLSLKALRRTIFAVGLACAAAAAQAQPAESTAPGISYAPPPEAEAAAEPAPEARPSSRPARVRGEIRPYLEIAQVVSAELDGGDTLTYTSVAAGVDGSIQTERVSVAMSYRYQRNIEWDDDIGDTDIHSGVAQVNLQIVPGVFNFDAGALATRTGGEGRAFGVTDRDQSVEVYSVYAGPTLATHSGPLAINASYRLGYVAIDDDTLSGGPTGDYDSAVAHAAAASVGMAPGVLPVGWTVGAGYARTDNDSAFEEEFEAAYIRGDVVLPVSPTLAVTAGVGYEDIEASQFDIARDASGAPLLGPDGFPVPDTAAPRVLTYDIDGIIYDAGIIWRPSARTELQARAGYRYGGFTFVGSLSHQFSAHTGMTASVFDSETNFGDTVINDLRGLPQDFEANRNPLTGDLSGCVFGGDAGTGVCLNQSLQSVRGGSFRLRGASVIFSGTRGLWSWGAGAGYAHRDFDTPDDPAFDAFGDEDQTFSLYASATRRLSRTADIGFDAYASWYDSDAAAFDEVFSTGATVTYSRQFLWDRMRILAAFGLYHSDDGTLDSTVANVLIGARYTF